MDKQILGRLSVVTLVGLVPVAVNANAGASAGPRSVDDLGKKLQVGTRCGSCVPELKALIAKG